MEIHRRTFFLLSVSPLVSSAARRINSARLGDVFFCRVSDSSLLPVAQSIYPQCIVSHEPRPGFRGITFCGSRSTLTVDTDRLA